MSAATALHKLTTQRDENPTIRAVEGWPWDASMKVIIEDGGSYCETEDREFLVFYFVRFARFVFLEGGVMGVRIVVGVVSKYLFI
jgi:hypothetical protein